MVTTNQKKFEDANPIQQWLIKKFQRRFLDVLASVQPTSILEVGCGEGFLLSKIDEHWPQVPKQGVDNYAPALEAGRQLFPSLRLVPGDIYRLPFADDSWDVTIASEVLEHLPDPAKALRELRRVAKRYVLLSVPFEPFFRLGNLARGRDIAALGNHPEHINQWSRASFAQFVEVQAHTAQVTSSFPWVILLADA